MVRDEKGRSQVNSVDSLVCVWSVSGLYDSIQLCCNTTVAIHK